MLIIISIFCHKDIVFHLNWLEWLVSNKLWEKLKGVSSCFGDVEIFSLVVNQTNFLSWLFYGTTCSPGQYLNLTRVYISNLKVVGPSLDLSIHVLWSQKKDIFKWRGGHSWEKNGSVLVTTPRSLHCFVEQTAFHNLIFYRATRFFLEVCLL